MESKLEREPRSDVDGPLLDVEAERFDGVSASVLRVRGAARRRPRRVRRAPVALGLGRPRREHRRVYRYWLLLEIITNGII